MDHEQLINDYFEGTLSAERKAELEHMLATDVSFREELIFQQKTKEAITQLKRKQLKEQLQQIEAEQKPRSFADIRWIAASVMIFVLLGIGIWQYQQSSDRLFAAYYQTMPNIEAPNVRGESSADIKTRAFSLYDQGDYASALQLFMDIYQREKADYALLYSGTSLMEIGRFEDAVQMLQQFEGSSSDYYYPIQWYTALAYIKTHQEEKAVAILKEIGRTENPFQSKATTLLEKLE